VRYSPKSVDYCMTIVSQFFSNLLHANRSLSHANRVSGRSFPALRETVFGRQRQKPSHALPTARFVVECVVASGVDIEPQFVFCRINSRRSKMKFPSSTE
jgi:hypothetical protein